MADVMDIDGPEFIEELNAQIATIRSSEHNEPMDIPLFNTEYKSIQSFSKVAVVDTNFLISNLAYLETLLELAESRHGSLLILIPWIVVRELDNLKKTFRKDSDNNDLNMLSRKAMKFLETHLRNKVKCLRGQKLHETIHENDLQHAKLKGDDLILDCCLYLQTVTRHDVILLSNDRNLCIKVMVHDIDSLSAASRSKMKEFTRAVSGRHVEETDRLIVQPVPRKEDHSKKVHSKTRKEDHTKKVHSKSRKEDHLKTQPMPREEVHPIVQIVEEDYSMDIDDECIFYDDMNMDGVEYNGDHNRGSSESRWAKESPELVAPKRPTPPPFNISVPMVVSKKSTWASVHAPKNH